MNYGKVMGLHKSGPVGLLLIVTTLLAVFAVPEVFGLVSGTGISVQQGVATVRVRVVDCAGNPVGSAVLQLQSLTSDQWSYTNSNGVATLPTPLGTYTLQGGYANFAFSQTINVGAGGATITVNLGAGCNSFSSSTQTQTPYYPGPPRNQR